VIIVLGIWVAVLPFLGFPNSWDRILFLISGFSISILMFLLRRDFFAYVEHLRRRKDSKQQTDSYVEKDPRAEAALTPESASAPSVEKTSEEMPQQPHEYAEAKPAKRARS